MIEKTPTIYNSGFTESDVKRIVEEENKNNYVWVNITDKLGTKETSGINTNYVNIFYNKNIGLIKLIIYTAFDSSVSGRRTIFNFNNDIPENGNTHVFSSESVSSLDGQYTGKLRAYPFTHSNTTLDHRISIDSNISYLEVFSGVQFTSVDKDIVEQFNAYLGL